MEKIFLIISILICLPGFVLANTPPQLTGGGAEPAFVKPGTDVTYRVEYSDIDGDPPVYIRVHFPPPIGAKEMKKVSGDYKAKAIYEYRWKPDQNWEYWFEASDGEGTARDPNYEKGTLSPVDVLPEIPENNKIYLFSQESSQPLWDYDTGEDWVHDVVVSFDGNYIAAKTNSYIYLFSRKNKNPLWKYQCAPETGKDNKAEASAGGGGIAISKNGEYLVGGCSNSLNLFSNESNNPIWTYQIQNANLYTVDMSSDGDYIVGGMMGSDELILFSKNSNDPLWKFKGEGDIHGLAISSDGNYIAAGAHCPDRRAFLFSSQSNQPLVSYLASQDSPVWVADTSSDGKYAVYGLDGGGGGMKNIFIFSPDKKEPLREYSVGGPVRSIAASEDGKYIAAASGADYSLYLFDRDSEQKVWSYKTGERVGTASISSDGNFIVTGSKDKKIYLFSRESSEPLWNYNAGEWVNSVAISGDSNYIAAGTGASQYLSEAHTVSFEIKPEETLGGTKEERAEEEKLKEGGETDCGNNICEPPLETYENCPQDCGLLEEKIKEETEKIKDSLETEKPSKNIFKKIWEAIINFFKWVLKT